MLGRIHVGVEMSSHGTVRESGSHRSIGLAAQGRISERLVQSEHRLHGRGTINCLSITYRCSFGGSQFTYQKFPRGLSSSFSLFVNGITGRVGDALDGNMSNLRR